MGGKCCCWIRDGSSSRKDEASSNLTAKPSPEKQVVEAVVDDKEFLSGTPTAKPPPIQENEKHGIIDPDPVPGRLKASSSSSSELGRASAVEHKAKPKLVVEGKSFKQQAIASDEDAVSVADAYSSPNDSQSRSTTTTTLVTQNRDDTIDAAQVVATNPGKQRLNRSPARSSTRGSMQRLAAGPSLRVVSNSEPRRSQSPVRKDVLGARRRRAGRESPVRVNGPKPITSSPDRYRMEESLENPLVSLECFIFL